ncbi:hypothetical protein [Blastochloris tepida]|uniref:Uncharacterized protein n=1 Tax=Blastochloris tepida TaxID=2233851 RepID=A0A348FZC6_9HYPH|nr:hypothetical protein [Blastochloris tepida]BBF92659.1 hypothetical protein BLTE_13440 [Blastochloris tepida]
MLNLFVGSTFLRLDTPAYVFVVGLNRYGRLSVRVGAKDAGRIRDVGDFWFSTPAGARGFIEAACRGAALRNR